LISSVICVIKDPSSS